MMKKLFLFVAFLGSVSLLNGQTISSINPTQGYKGQTLSVTISGQNTHFNQGTQTISFKQGTSTYFNGSNSTGTATSLLSNVSIPLTAPLGYYDLEVQNSTDGILSLANAFLVTPNSPTWPVTVTGLTHSIVVPNYANITVDGLAISNGDFLGVFYEYGGNLNCAGYLQWNGSTQNLLAYGDVSGINGFTTGEIFTWKIWKISNNTQYVGNAIYQGSPTFPNTNTFVSGGSSGISSLSAFTVNTQTINIPLGWSLMSTFINPTNPAINQVFAPVVNNMVIVKNGSGQLYWPLFNINQIGNIVNGQGYQLNFSIASSLTISGTALVPQVTPLNIPQGWSFLGYIRQSNGLIVTMLSSIVSNITIVKDATGNVYWPVFNVNNIVTMVPGKGYQIRLTTASILYYPANNEVSAKMDFNKTKPMFFEIAEPAGNNMTLGIPKKLIFENGFNVGDEIGCFSEKGKLVGSEVFTGNNIALTIWGGDELSEADNVLTDNESFSIVFWNRDNNITYPVQELRFSEGDASYSNNKIAVVSDLKLYESGLTLEEIYPNPAIEEVNIVLNFQNQTRISLEVFDYAGKLVKLLFEGLVPDSRSVFSIETSTFVAGQYMVKLTSENNIETRFFQVIK
jgi:hypothetical protein